MARQPWLVAVCGTPSHGFLRDCHSRVDAYRIQLCLRRPSDTSSQSLGYLAATLRSGCTRKCRPAKSAVLAVAARDMLQGAFEKIHLQNLLCEQTLQITNFSSKPRLTGFRQNRVFALFSALALLVPPV